MFFLNFCCSFVSSVLMLLFMTQLLLVGVFRLRAVVVESLFCPKFRDFSAFYPPKAGCYVSVPDFCSLLSFLICWDAFPVFLGREMKRKTGGGSSLIITGCPHIFFVIHEVVSL